MLGPEFKRLVPVPTQQRAHPARCDAESWWHDHPRRSVAAAQTGRARSIGQCCVEHTREWGTFYTVRKIIQVKQKSVSRSPFFYFYWYFNTRNWYLHRYIRTYKARLVWRSKHKSWCCNTSIWYCPIESMPKVGTFQSNFGIKICGANSKNSHF